jgi:hypothetical protein
MSVCLNLLHILLMIAQSSPSQSRSSLASSFSQSRIFVSGSQQAPSIPPKAKVSSIIGLESKKRTSNQSSFGTDASLSSNAIHFCTLSLPGPFFRTISWRVALCFSMNVRTARLTALTLSIFFETGHLKYGHRSAQLDRHILEACYGCHWQMAAVDHSQTKVLEIRATAGIVGILAENPTVLRDASSILCLK